MANHEDLHITLTLLIGVAIGCGALYWSARKAAPAPLTSTNLSTPATLPSAPVAPSIPKPIAVRPVEHANDRPPPADQAEETPPSNYDGPDLPVVFAFSERSVYTTEEGADGKMVNVSKRVKEGIIFNSSDKALTITATEVNIATQETLQTQFVLNAGTQRHFGSEQGLKMISGDQMTLRSATYRDSVQQIP